MSQLWSLAGTEYFHLPHRQYLGGEELMRSGIGKDTDDNDDGGQMLRTV